MTAFACGRDASFCAVCKSAHVIGHKCTVRASRHSEVQTNIQAFDVAQRHAAENEQPAGGRRLFFGESARGNADSGDA